MNNYRKISFDIDFAGKKVLNTIQMPLEELTQNDFNSSLLTLKLMQGQELINLQGLSVVLNFLMPSGKDYVDTINAEMIDIENSIVSYSIPKDILSEVGMVVGTVSLYKEGYRYTSIVQFKFEVVSDFVEDGEIVESDNYPILAQMIGEVQNLKDEEMKRVESEIERIENEEERESSELQREMNEVERHEAENVRIINEQNREVKELERDQAERLREANSAKVKREEETRLEAETLRVQAESLRVGAESDRIQAESIRQMQESDRHEKELERQAAENLRVLAEIEREQKQNEFNTRAEEVAVRIEEESQRISDLVEIEESKLVKPNDMVDYMGNQHNSLKAKSDSDVDYAVKTAIGEFNYLDYEGQHITANNSIEGHTKSAILKGNTLVNLSNTPREVETMSQIAFPIVNIKPNTQYTILYQIKSSNELTPVSVQSMFRIDNIIDSNGTALNVIYGHTDTIKTNYSFKKVVITSRTDTVGMRIVVRNAFQDNGLVENTLFIKDLIILEGDYTNVDIPYFTGMQSVKMPVLKTVGKNLFDVTKHIELKVNNDGSYSTIGTPSSKYDVLYQLEPNTDYILSFDKFGDSMCWVGCRINGIFSNNSGGDLRKKITTDSSGLVTISFGANSANDVGHTITNIQLEKSSMYTSYEPYKTNILSTPSDLELRGIGDAQDTLDLNTGEMTQQIESFVLDGINHKLTKTAYEAGRRRFDTDITNLKIIGNEWVKTELVATSDKLRPCDFYTAVKTMSPCLIAWKNMLAITLEDESIDTVDKANNYLQNNPIEIQYVLDTPVHKTVDLSDNVVYSYNGTTHYSCSSEEGSLVPTLSVKVPTDVQEVISEQRKIISEQEEAQNILIDSQLSLYESISGIQTLQTNGEEVQMPQYIIDLYELAYKRGIRKKGER